MAGVPSGEEKPGETQHAAEAEEEGEGGEPKARQGRIQGKKRPVEDIDEDELVPIPPFQQEHKTWVDLDDRLKQCMLETRQVIVVKEVIHVARRNATLRDQL
ncbi:hypothetical protein PI125_g19625 [Phytophthora idaei]|nr:hypothetical protein PI125_g19625 [Phytophthora idaei]